MKVLKHWSFRSLLIVALFAAGARAAVTNVVWYRLGESDADATSGQPVTNPTTDLIGFRDLIPFGGPLYTNAVSTNAASRLGSSLAVHFNGTSQFLSNSVLMADVNNFGIEAWVKPNATNNAFAFIGYNGASTAGWGLVQSGNGYYGFIQNGGLAYVGTPAAVAGTAVPGTWTHVALVRDNGANKLFINGALMATTATAPGTPTATFTVGFNAHRAGSYFDGSIDEVRVFRFAAGGFSTNDLAWNTVPPPPVVTTLPAQSVRATNATLRGTVNAGVVVTEAWFEWGATTNYGNVTSPQIINDPGNQSLSQVIGGLGVNGTYHYRVVASNSHGVVRGTNASFTTVAIPEATTLPPADITTNSATLKGLVHGFGAPTTVRFYLNSVVVALQEVGSNSNALSVSFDMTGLASSTFYNFRVGASNAYGQDFGTNYILTTMGPPVITTLPATNIGLSDATLQGVVNPRGTNTDVWFEWGTSTNYGSATPVQSMGGGGTAVSFSQLLTNLGGGITYHFRVVGSNYFGTIYSSNRTFTIPGFTRAITNLPSIAELPNAAAWGDYDNDGLLDLLLSTETNGPIQIWRNVGGGFTNINAGLPVVFAASVAWGDYDNDGRLDVLLAGRTNASTSDCVAQIWRNMGAGVFSNINAGLPGVFSGSVAWGDCDNDGKLDVLLAGRVDPSNCRTEVWRNTGNSFTNINAGLPGIWFCSVAWGDYDNDGRLDILIGGLTNSTSFGLCQVWRNTGNGFSNINAGLTSVGYATVAWGDYDNDGRMDILLNGANNSGLYVGQVWRNAGNSFTQLASLPPLGFATAAWGDYDNDGRLDAMVGRDVWRNIGNGFTNINAELPFGGAIIWGDYDNDGKLDLLLSREVWRNNTQQSNTPPATPSGLSVSATGDVVTLTWNAAGDAQTPSPGLSYNLRVGTTPGGSEVSGPAMAAASGYRRIVQRAPRQTRSFTFNHTAGTPYYWSVQAIDPSFAGSPFAVEESFKVLSQQAVVPITTTNLAPGDIDGDGIVSTAEFAAVLSNLNGNGVVSEAELNLVLSNYFSHSPWLAMTNVAGLGGTNVTFALTNLVAGSFSVEFSTNLTNWFPLGSATPRYLFTDTNAPSQPTQRFYRLRWP